MSAERKTKDRTYQVVVALAQNDEAGGDGIVAAVDPEDRRHVQGLTWDGIWVRWRVEDQTLPPMVQAWACLGAHWVEGEAHVEVEEDHEDQVGAGRHPVVEVCKGRGVADDQMVEVREEEAGHVVLVEVLGQWGLVIPWLEMLGKIQGPEKDRMG